MIETINKLIGILVGISEYPFILDIRDLKPSYRIFVANYLEEISYYYYDMGLEGVDILNHLKGFDFKLFLQWFFSSPNVIISFVFYLLVAWGVFYFCLIVPYRLIKQILPKAIRGGKK